MTIQSVHKKLFRMFDTSECIKLNQMHTLGTIDQISKH